MDTTPKNDIIFKILFGDQRHPRILIHFLNSVLDLENPIKSVQIKQTELTPEVLMQKGSRLDVLATTDTGEIINVEIQKKDGKNIKERSLFYWSRLFSGQATVGEKYNDLHKTICINVLNFPLFEDGRYWHKNFLTDSETHEKLTDLVELHFFELPKVKIRKDNSPITFWLRFIDNPQSVEIKELYKLEPVYQEAKSVYDKAIADPNVAELIRIQEKADMDYKDAIATSHDAGKAEGEKIGIEKGKSEGRVEEKIEVAKSGLNMGLSIEQVSKLTGLSLEEIAKL